MAKKYDKSLKYSMPWYQISANRLVATLGGLKREVNADICIVGAGFTGLSAGFELALKGFSVIILESNGISTGPSGRNGGQFHRGFDKSPAELIEKFGKHDAKVMCDVTMEGIRLIKDRIAEHDIKCDFKPGALTAATDESQVKGLEEDAAGWAKLGYNDLVMLDRQQTQEMVHVKSYIGGRLDPTGGHFHPYNYGLGLARAAQKAGCKFFDHTRATAIIHGDTAKVVTEHGAVNAKFVILAGAIKLKGSESMVRRSITASAHMIATEPMNPKLVKTIMSKDVAVSDARFIMDYYRLSGDNRLLFGGNCNYSDMDYPGEGQRLRARMLKIFPQLSMTRIDHCWHGPLEFTINRLPGLGRLAANVYYAHGFGGQGVILTNAAGAILAEAVAGHAERFDVFAKIKHANFPGGNLFKRPAFVLGMTWYRVRDALSS